MAGKYMELHSTPGVLAAQEHYYGQGRPIPPQGERDALTPHEVHFIQMRDSFYMASVTEAGWPYIQHRGGSPGFLKVIGENRLAFADFRGNRQLLTTGNLAGNDKVALFLMDYPGRARLKIMGHAQVLDAREHPGLADQIAEPSQRKNVERILQVDVISYDWNCHKYITPRFTEAEVREAVQPLRDRIAELERELAAAAGTQRPGPPL